MNNFLTKHKTYFSVLLYVAGPVSFIYSIVTSISSLFQGFSEGFMTGVFVLLVNVLLFSVGWAVAFFLFWLCLLVFTLVPYLIIRGFVK